MTAKNDKIEADKLYGRWPGKLSQRPDAFLCLAEFQNWHYLNIWLMANNTARVWKNKKQNSKVWKFSTSEN